MFGDFLYILSAKDQQSLGVQLQHYHTEKQVGAGPVIQDIALFPVPPDRLFVMQSAVMSIKGGGIITPSFCQFWADSHGVQFTLGGGICTIALALTPWVFGLISSPIIFEPNTVFGYSANFSGFHAQNIVTFDVIGYTIPRGNIGLA